jgi:glycerol-3-phosphate dehydrogenase (NAD(P)+)
LWVHDPDLAAMMAKGRENPVYLPGFRLPDNVWPDSNGAAVLEGAGIVLGVMPSRFARHVYGTMLGEFTPSMRFVSATKGIEQGSLLRMSEVMRQSIQPRFEPEIAVLSGPTFAREIAQGDPAAVVISSENDELASTIQARFSGPAFRLYRNRDPLGVEVGAALKNVIAIAAGICQGLGFGGNALAALITRGLVEMTRLAVAMGAEPGTLSGLAGLGDLVLTCTGELSRNKAVGIELSKGRKLDDIVRSTKMIAEGIETTSAALALACKHGVELPITRQMGLILRCERTPGDAVRDLMDRSLKDE